MADQEDVNETFRKVNEFRELHDLIHTHLTALCARAPRAPISHEAEYKALRDEMMHLLNRIFVLLAAMVGGSIVVFYRALELRNTSPWSAFGLVLALCGTLAVAIVLTYKMHEHIDKIRFYILVYHEPDSGGWHSLVAEFNKYRKGLPDLPRTHKLIFSSGDLDVISLLYVVLVLIAAGMVSIFPPIIFESYFRRLNIGRWLAFAIVFGALATLLLALLRSLRSGYNTGLASMECWWRDFKNKPAAKKTPPDVEDWVDVFRRIDG
jgi:hypothetical protein